MPNRIVVGKKYTKEQLDAFRLDPQLESMKMQGYVLRLDDDGMFSFVPWQAASRSGQGRTYQSTAAMTALKDGLTPIVKRTPQERVDSLMLRFIDDCKRAGTVPGLDDAMVSTIVGAAWMGGRTEVTGEMVRRIAQHFLEKSEKDFEAAESKRVTRTTGAAFA